MIFAGLELARRVEAGEALNGTACAEAERYLHPESGATVEPFAGGWAIFVGAGSPLTQAIGLGMQGPVQPEEIGRLEAFYRSRGSGVSIDLCPLSDPSLVELLGNRGYRPTEFNNVLVRPLAADEAIAPEISVRQAGECDQELWAGTVTRGFLETDSLADAELDVGRNIFQMPGSRCYWAFRGDQPGAAGALTIHAGLAILYADSTVPAFRGGGLQNALIRERLRAALDQHCDLVTATTLPGSVSQRNYERNGFRVAYTKTTMVR